MKFRIAFARLALVSTAFLPSAALAQTAAPAASPDAEADPCAAGLHGGFRDGERRAAALRRRLQGQAGHVAARLATDMVGVP